MRGVIHQWPSNAKGVVIRQEHVLLPSVVIKRSSSGGGCSGALRRRGAGERTMNAMGVVIVSELPASV